MADRDIVRANLKSAIGLAAEYLRGQVSLSEWLVGQGGDGPLPSFDGRVTEDDFINGTGPKDKQPVGILSAGQFKAALPATEDYDNVRADLVGRLKDAFLTFVSSRRGQASRNAARKAIAEDVPAAFYAGYADAGGEDTEDDDERWLTAEQARQLDFLVDAFQALADDRDNETAKESAIDDRIEIWAATLDAIYAQGKLRGAANKMLTWQLGQTEKHCSTCSKLDGQRHGAKWWLAHDYIPREPGSDTLECGGWNCDCRLEYDNGDEFTVSG